MTQQTEQIEYVAKRIVRIGDRRLSPGETLPAKVERNRLVRMLKNGEVVRADDPEAPLPAPLQRADDDDEDDSPEVDDRPFPRSVGGGWYELSDGARAQGKANAYEQQALLNELDGETDDDGEA